MANIGIYSKTKQIKNLLYVFGTAVVSALLRAGGMIYYYNPAGVYKAKNVLLTPENAFTLHYVEPGTQQKGRIVFDRLQFSYFDPEIKKQKIVAVAQSVYAKFYTMVEEDSSILEPDHAIFNKFNEGNPAVLALKVQIEGGGASRALQHTFAQVDFAAGGDYYRVQLRQQSAGIDWVYFHHPGIYQQFFNLLP